MHLEPAINEQLRLVVNSAPPLVREDLVCRVDLVPVKPRLPSRALVCQAMNDEWASRCETRLGDRKGTWHSSQNLRAVFFSHVLRIDSFKRPTLVEPLIRVPSKRCDCKSSCSEGGGGFHRGVNGKKYLGMPVLFLAGSRRSPGPRPRRAKTRPPIPPAASKWRAQRAAEGKRAFWCRPSNPLLYSVQSTVNLCEGVYDSAGLVSVRPASVCQLPATGIKLL